MSTYVFDYANEQTGYEPWLFSAELNGSDIINDFAPGTDSSLESSPANFTRFGIGALFSATTADEGTELWFTDGTLEGTHLVADIAPGPRSSYPADFPGTFTISGNLAYFGATTYQHGNELWVTDGTVDGTHLVADLATGQSGSDPANLQAFGAGVIFSSSRIGGIWYADESGATNLTQGVNGVHHGKVVTTDDLIVFSTSEIWVSDGTPEGTHSLFGEGNPFGIAGISQIEANLSLVYFTAETILGNNQLFVTDGTIGGTRLLVNSGAHPNSFSHLEVTNNCIFYLDEKGGFWSLRSGFAQPERLISMSWGPLYTADNVDGLTFFKAKESGKDYTSIWITDGTTSGTKQLMEGNYSTLLSIESDRLLVGRLEGFTTYILEVSFDGEILSRIASGYSYNFIEIGGEVWGTLNNEVLNGGAGDDTIFGMDGHDVINGGAGADVLNGGAGNDTIEAGDGRDIINGGIGADSLLGGAGNDTIYGMNGFDLIHGGDGDDRLSGGAGNDTIFGGAGNDNMLGGLGADKLFGGSGQDAIYGIEGIDLLDGGAGDDWLEGGNGNDTLLGGAGDDTLSGGLGSDFLDGGSGNDELRGLNGHDLLIGGAGDDLLHGGAGHDTLIGGPGNDTMRGGQGADVFVFNAGHDVITDYSLIVDALQIEADLLDEAAPVGNDLRNYASVANGNLIFDFGDNHTLTLNGVTNIDPLLVDVTFI